MSLMTGILKTIHDLATKPCVEKNALNSGDDEEEMEDDVSSQSSTEGTRSSNSGDEEEDDDSSTEYSVLSENQYMGEEDEEVGDYYLVRYIGSGSFGVVWKATRKEDDDAVVAVKISRKDELSDREVRILSLLGEHPNIVSLYDAFQFDDDRRFVLVMNLMRSNLFDFMRKFSEKKVPVNVAKSITRQLLLALQHLATHKVVHTDLKPENILVDDSDPDNVLAQFADFGSASSVGDNDICKYGKTVAYRSPEVLCNAYRCTRPPADTWSIACVIFELFAGTVLFDPHQSHTYSAKNTGSASTSPEMNKQQLSLMVELLGKFPKRFAMANRKYFNRLGHLKDVGEIKQIDLRAIMVVECEMEHALAMDLYDFLMPMLLYTPRLRAKPEVLLQSRFLSVEEEPEEEEKDDENNDGESKDL